jgi:exosome complex RNA-binding protein Csl4
MKVEGITLEKIDLLRQRAGVSYREAYEVLEETQGDVVRALIKLEEKPRTVTEKFQARGSELLARVRELIRQGNVNRIVVKQEEKVLLDIPVTVGAIGAVLMPYLAALGVIAALATRCTIEVERRQP